MKTITQIQERIEQIIEQSSNVAPSTRKDNLLEVNHLRDVIRYLETDPTEEFMRNELSKLNSLINSTEESWNEQYAKHKYIFDRMALSTLRARKAEFLKEYDLETIKKQIRVLGYILN